MFKDDLLESTRRRFRESTSGRGDIQLQWLLTALRVSDRSCSGLMEQVERWREALLWTFIVVRLGHQNGEGMLDQNAIHNLRRILGTDNDSTLQVLRGPRETLTSLSELWQSAGLTSPKATEMLFSMWHLISPVSRLAAEATPQLVWMVTFHP